MFNDIQTHTTWLSILASPRPFLTGVLLRLDRLIMLVDFGGVFGRDNEPRVNWSLNSSSVSARMGGLSWSQTNGFQSALVNGVQAE